MIVRSCLAAISLMWSVWVGAFEISGHHTRLSVFAVTNHIGKSGMNDWHPMLQIELDRTWTTGVFVNSHSDLSVYVARRFQSTVMKSRPFVEIGAVSGYSNSMVRSIRIGLELHDNLDFVIMPGFQSLYSWQIDNPISVIGIIVKF